MSKWHHNRETVFALTDTESRALALREKGATWKQIDSLGLNKALLRANEKIAIRQAEKDYRPTAGTTLAKARRTLRPIVNVRQGKWKTGE